MTTPQSRQSAILTDEAVRAAREAFTGRVQPDGVVYAFLAYHRTEGREALVERVANVLHREFLPDDAECGTDCGVCGGRAEAVITALFGEADDA